MEYLDYININDLVGFTAPADMAYEQDFRIESARDEVSELLQDILDV